MSEQLIQASEMSTSFFPMPFPPQQTRAMCRGYHMATWAPYGSISQRDSQEHKNAAVYFYGSPFSFPPSALQMASAPLLDSHT